MINAVELMLDSFDQKISDRYKLIDYRETDFQKTIVFFASAYFVQFTIPVFLGKYLKPTVKSDSNFHKTMFLVRYNLQKLEYFLL